MRESPVELLTPALSILAFLLFTMAGISSPAPGHGYGDPGELPTAEGIRDLLDTGRLTEAEASARLLLTRAEWDFGTRSLATATAIDLLVEAQIQLKQELFSDAVELAERAVTIKETHAEATDLDLATSLTNLGHVRRAQLDFDAARTAFERAYSLREERLGRLNPDTALTLTNLGMIARLQERPEKAREYFQLSLGRLEEVLGPDHPDLAEPLIRLGRLTDRIDADYAGSQAFCRRALRILESDLGTDNPKLVPALNCISVSHWRLGDYPEARASYERQLRILERSMPPYMASSTLLNMGILFEEWGDYQRARASYERSYEVQEAAGRPGVVSAQNGADNYARLLMKMGAHEESREILEGLLQARRKAWGEDHSRVYRTKGYLGRLLAETGELEAAAALIEENLAFQRRHYGNGHPKVAWSLTDMALVLRERGDLEAAHSALEEALRILEKVVGKEHPWMSEILNDLALVDLLDGRPLSALDEALSAAATLRRSFDQILGSLSEPEALRIQSIRREGLDVALAALTSAEIPVPARERVWDELVRSRGFVLDRIAARNRRIHRSDSSQVELLWSEWERAGARLARLALRGPSMRNPEVSVRDFVLASENKERLERSLSRISSHFRSDLAGSRAGLAQIRQALPDRTGLVAFVEYNNVKDAEPVPSYVALVLSGRESASQVVSLGSVEVVERSIRQWRDLVGGPHHMPEHTAAYRSAARTLRHAVWDPLEEALKDVDQVFVVSDGELNLLNLATLPEGADRYLLETGPRFHYLTAERDLVRAVEPEVPGKGLLIVGNPDYGIGPRVSARRVAYARRTADESSCTGKDLGSLRFDTLHSADAEADLVERLWWTSTSGGVSSEAVVKLSGSEADEASFKRLAPGHRIIHLATHGFIRADTCEPSPDERSAWHSLLSESSPLLFTGLALAGANRRTVLDPEGEQEDGLLTAEEIAALDLTGVEWAVLSACETGLGRIQTGEGVLGLRRAFQVAGANTVIMSLWSVNDHATREWIHRLYAGRLSGLTTTESVQQASLGILRERREAGFSTHPFYWGGFVAAGDWR